MDEKNLLAAKFEESRTHLKSAAYRMLGSVSEADDAVQEAWLRLSRSDTSGIENLKGWLTTVVARVCLDMLRARTAKKEEPLGVHVPDPIVSREGTANPAHQAQLAESMGLALLVVLETLAPAERIAFVLHDMFGVSFEDIAPIVGKSATASRQLASRARRRIQGAGTTSDADIERQRQVVDAFLAASREGNFEALLTVLDPDVVLRLDRGASPPGASREIRGARAVAGLGFRFSGDGWFPEHAHVNGGAGIVITRGGIVFSVIAFVIKDSKITAIDILADPKRLKSI